MPSTLSGFKTRKLISPFLGNESKGLKQIQNNIISYQVGGFYSDLDSITIKDLTNLRNVIGTSSAPEPSPKHCAAGEFHFDKKHNLLFHALKRITETYKGKNMKI